MQFPEDLFKSSGNFFVFRSPDHLRSIPDYRRSIPGLSPEHTGLPLEYSLDRLRSIPRSPLEHPEHPGLPGLQPRREDVCKPIMLLENPSIFVIKK